MWEKAVSGGNWFNWDRVERVAVVPTPSGSTYTWAVATFIGTTQFKVSPEYTTQEEAISAVELILSGQGAPAAS